MWRKRDLEETEREGERGDPKKVRNEKERMVKEIGMSWPNGQDIGLEII